MECHRADELIMKYMDSVLDESEAAKLGEHLTDCPGCAEDFKMYDSILTGFSEMDMISAPEGFEERVMRRVAELPSVAAKLTSSVENMMCLVWGSVSALFGIGFLAALNREMIMEYMYSQPGLAGYASALALIGEYSSALANALTLIMAQTAYSMAGYVSTSRYVLIAILAALAAARLAAGRRAKASAKHL